MDFLGFITLIIAGFTACAEFASYALVHPVIRYLPQKQHIRFEQGSLKTYGLIMPIFMPASVILTLSFALFTKELGSIELASRFSTAGMFILATIITIRYNVPINKEIKQWDADNPPADWKEIRKRWMFFQSIRSWLLLFGFVLLCFSVTI
ncbi:anthrone oxygenase family protein [Cytobacillus oceanisediminis]|uniref:anthrone oxygenase family protein n=1 Tax=Cytobacillus oceanisediminis TaxID=665099 RepID=UPI003736520B